MSEELKFALEAPSENVDGKKGSEENLNGLSKEDVAGGIQEIEEILEGNAEKGNPLDMSKTVEDSAEGESTKNVEDKDVDKSQDSPAKGAIDTHLEALAQDGVNIGDVKYEVGEYLIALDNAEKGRVEGKTPYALNRLDAKTTKALEAMSENAIDFMEWAEKEGQIEAVKKYLDLVDEPTEYRTGLPEGFGGITKSDRQEYMEKKAAAEKIKEESAEVLDKESKESQEKIEGEREADASESTRAEITKKPFDATNISAYFDTLKSDKKAKLREYINKYLKAIDFEAGANGNTEQTEAAKARAVDIRDNRGDEVKGFIDWIESDQKNINIIKNLEFGEGAKEADGAKRSEKDSDEEGAIVEDLNNLPVTQENIERRMNLLSSKRQAEEFIKECFNAHRLVFELPKAERVEKAKEYGAILDRQFNDMAQDIKDFINWTGVKKGAKNTPEMIALAETVGIKIKGPKAEVTKDESVAKEAVESTTAKEKQGEIDLSFFGASDKMPETKDDSEQLDKIYIKRGEEALTNTKNKLLRYLGYLASYSNRKAAEKLTKEQEARLAAERAKADALDAEADRLAAEQRGRLALLKKLQKEIRGAKTKQADLNKDRLNNISLLTKKREQRKGFFRNLLSIINKAA